jgi:hypothetical protein
LTGIFVFRAFQHVPRSRSSEPIRSWMSVTYIAHAHRVPPAGLYQAIGLPPESLDKRPIVEIARSQDRPTGELFAELQRAIIQARASPPADSSSLSIAPPDSSLLILPPSDSPAIPTFPTDSLPRPSSTLESSPLPSSLPDSSPHPPSPPAPPPHPAKGENAS